MACCGSYSNVTEIEEQFVTFYSNIIRELYEEKIENNVCIPDLKEALSTITNISFNMSDRQKKLYYDYVNFREDNIRFAYVYAFCIINACTVYDHFTHFFNKKEDLKRIIETKKSISICCLGGGPGPEAIAICKIINEFLRLAFSNSSSTESAIGNRTSPISIIVTIVDMSSQWKNESFDIINSAIHMGIVDSELATIKTKFFQAHLLEDIQMHLQEEIRRADIVTMVRLGGEIVNRKPQMLSALSQNLCRIVELMKVDSCLFIQEEAEGLAFPELKNAICCTVSTNIESYEYRDYNLTQESQQTFRNLGPMDLINDINLPVSRSQVSSCIWVHTNPVLKEEMPAQ